MYEQEIAKPSEIADGLSMSVKEVNTQKFALKRILKGKRFLISYIADNHSHLEHMAIAILDKKLERAIELAEYLDISKAEARTQREELLSILNSIRTGAV